MLKFAVLLFFCAGFTYSQVRTLTLREALELALKQNPDLALAQLNERKARQAVRLARDAFIPSLTVGSGLAYSNGFPLSIEGSAPSIVQAQATSFVFNRPQSYRIAQAKESAKGAVIDTAARREEIALQTALLFLDAERASRIVETAQKQVQSLERIAETVRLRVSEGRELPVEAKRADLNLARARQRVQTLEADRDYTVSSLATVLGFDPDERLRILQQERELPPTPVSQEACIKAALEGSKELRGLESALMAKGFEVRAERASRLPQADLVAQYAVLGRFNNYEDFFRKFQRQNGQIGVSFRLPIFSATTDARVSQAETEVAHLRVQLRSARNRVSLETQRLYQQANEAQTARQVAKLDLDVAREQLSVLLAQMDEGRASLQQVEQARFTEDEKWIAFVDSHYAEEKARLNLLKQTGEILALLY